MIGVDIEGLSADACVAVRTNRFNQPPVSSTGYRQHLFVFELGTLWYNSSSVQVTKRAKSRVTRAFADQRPNSVFDQYPELLKQVIASVIAS